MQGCASVFYTNVTKSIPPHTSQEFFGHSEKESRNHFCSYLKLCGVQKPSP